MASARLTGNCTALLNPGKYNGSHAWGNCPQCVEPNVDIAGIGVIVGIVGQAFLLIVAVLGWWIVNVPLQWTWVSNSFKTRTVSRSVLVWIHLRKDEIQKLLLISSNTQVVTGLSLTIAGLIRFQANPPISTYHACIISDLLSISANGQAAMLFYAFRPKDNQPVENYRFPWKKFTPRIFLSLVYIGVFFAWSIRLRGRFISPVHGRDCFINLPPQNGNYGNWSIFEAALMLVFVILAILQGQIRFLVPQEDQRRRRFFKLFYDSFPPSFILAYFLWSFVDLVAIKRNIAIAISRRHCREAPFERYGIKPEDIDENGPIINDDNPHDLQSGRTTHIAGMIYARELVENRDVVVGRRQKFREVSEGWHQFLNFMPSQESAWR